MYTYIIRIVYDKYRYDKYNLYKLFYIKYQNVNIKIRNNINIYIVHSIICIYCAILRYC